MINDNVFKSRQILLRWVGWFFFINFLLSCFISLIYLRIPINFNDILGITTLDKVAGWLFLFLAFITQAAIFNFISAGIVALIALFFPKKKLVMSVGILFGAIIVITYLAESTVYGIFHLHYVTIAWSIIDAGALPDVIPLSIKELSYLIGTILIFLCLEYLIARTVLKRASQIKPRLVGKNFAKIIISSVMLSYGAMAIATITPKKHFPNQTQQHVILRAARVAPYFSDIYALIMPGMSGVRSYQTPEGPAKLEYQKLAKPIHYPLTPTICHQPKKLFNIVIIAIDTWRFDAMNKIVSPNIAAFAPQTLQFEHHLSGGICTQSGIFSLFYGLPSPYWYAFLNQNKSPVLINQLQRDNYQMGIFTSAPLDWPAFNNTVFKHILHLILKTPGDSSVSRDQKITTEFQHFVNNRSTQKPFFSFLFYDAVHNYCESENPTGPFHPAIKSCNRFTLTNKTDPTPYINRYHNSVYFVDQEVAKVLATLKEKQLLKNTIVIITADHGEQLNDQGMGYWVHGSAYTKYQMHIPMLVYWPGKTPRKIDYLTTHLDVAPTLLTQALGCTSPVSQYSVGHSLFVKGSSHYMIAGNYIDYAIVTPTKITRIYPNGDYSLNNFLGHTLYQQPLNGNLLRAASNELNRFFAKNGVTK